MNLSTLIVLCILIGIVVLDIRYLMKNGIDSCSGDCRSCGPSCKWANDVKKAQRKIRFQKKLKQLFQMK